MLVCFKVAFGFGFGSSRSIHLDRYSRFSLTPFSVTVATLWDPYAPGHPRRTLSGFAGQQLLLALY